MAVTSVLDAYRRRQQAANPGVVQPPAIQTAAPRPTIAPGVTVAQPQGAQPPPAPAIAPSRFQPTIVPPPKPGAPGGPSIQRPATDVPGAPEHLTPFGPGDDLRFQQINPLATERLRTLQGQVTGAAGGLSGGPNLREAAAERLKLFEEQSEPGFQRALQDVGRRASALGRLGAGMTTSELGDVTTQRERALSQARRGLASDLAFAEGGERRANLASLGGLEGQLFGQEQGQREELRGERGYQSGTAQQALENRIRQRTLEEQLLSGAFGRQMGRAELGLRGAEQYGAQAEGAGNTAADLLQQIAFLESLKQQRGRTTVGQPYGERPG